MLIVRPSTSLSATWYQDVLRPFAEWALRPMQADSFDSSQAHDIIHNLAKTSG
ncbi:hypothetical protein [Thiothrix winogradskyi]|uniref:Uncharacterized protein n=1 Tax=Thiothrix winogradskyi TaxID=96472 RepID=A0ABY3T2H5_9GAMM|nr:hypothetical protein [Thiothrix winogradskyi]UJS24698.1 hypothetical protein L2Y54_01295 [Thiothrix winogradskyi]